MSNPFKVGDRIKVKPDNNINGKISSGSIYKVVAVNSEYVYVDAFPSDGWFPDRFELVPAKAPQKSVPGSYGTGKGTTARIAEYLVGRFLGRTVAEIAAQLGLPSRQLHKRLSEMVKAGTLWKGELFEGGSPAYFHARRSNDEQLVDERHLAE